MRVNKSRRKEKKMAVAKTAEFSTCSLFKRQ